MTIAAIEEGRQDPKWGTLRRLAKGLNIEVQALNALAYELAPGREGDRLRRREREAWRLTPRREVAPED